MILLKLKGEKVIGVYENISPTYAPNENEVLIQELPPCVINNDEIAKIYYRDGNIVYVVEKRL